MLTPSNLLCLIVQGAGGGGFKFKKTPQVHLIIIREWPKNNLPPF